MSGRRFGPREIISHPAIVQDSYAWRARSLSARRIIDDLELDAVDRHCNGRLVCPYDDLNERYEMDDKSIAAGFRELYALGLVEQTLKGSARKGGRRPSEYRLTYIEDHRNPKFFEPGITHEWRRFASLKDARRAAKEARAREEKEPATEVREETIASLRASARR